MTGGKLLLLFLGFIFIFVIVLSSSRIAKTLRSRLGKFFPFPSAVKQETIKITPTPTVFYQKLSFQIPSPTKTNYGESTDSSQIPKTGPSEVLLLLSGSGLVLGYALRKISG